MLTPSQDIAMVMLNFFPFFLSPCQDDHLAAKRQAADPVEQSQGVPPEIHPAVFLNFATLKGRSSPSTTTKNSANHHLCVTNKCLLYDGPGGLCDDALRPLQQFHSDIGGRYTRHCFCVGKTKQNWR